eukprot:PLAT1570.1.p1 GENE.PLAT1570.1~~PLAT1570.1.p1  ORF type:complete len:411 (+),score=74.10 PLAT1570.1:17-1249(+)
MAALDEPAGFLIPLRSIWDEFTCPVCLEPITDCYMTACGHNFCHGCIDECLARRHTCPSCNTECTRDQLVKNLSLDNLLQKLSEQRQAASDEYFAKLTGSAKADDSSGGKEGSEDAGERSPIEAVFQRHMQRSLLGFQSYYEDLKRKHVERTARVKTELAEALEDVAASAAASLRRPADGPPILRRDDSTDRAASLRRNCEAKLAELQQRFDAAVGVLVDSYDRYMSELAPSPALVPATVTIEVEDRHMRFDAQVKSTSFTADMIDVVQARFRDLGDPVVEFGADVQWKLKPAEVSKEDELISLDDDRPIFEQSASGRIDPGVHLLLVGSVKLSSMAPKACFKAEFVKGAGMVMDYYRCNDCGFNWVCKPCADQCHAAHSLVPFRLKHKPSYACCYCVKKKVCTIYSKKK